MQYSHSEAVQPYIVASTCLARGLELCLVQGEPELGYQALGHGYAICHRYIRYHKNDIAAGLCCCIVVCVAVALK
jgi:hypothetical protein